MDRLTPPAQALLQRYRNARPGPDTARRNLRAVTERAATDVPGSTWGRSLAWGLGSAAAAALLLVVVDAFLPAPTSAVQTGDVGSRSEAIHGAEAAAQDGDATQRAVSAAHGAPADQPAAQDQFPEGRSASTSAPHAPKSADIHTEPTAGAELELELKLLRAARAQLREGRFDDASRTLAEHEQRFPRGALAEDREAYQAVVACRSDRHDAAEKRAAFRAAYPHSPHAPRVAEACDKPITPQKPTGR